LAAKRNDVNDGVVVVAEDVEIVEADDVAIGEIDCDAAREWALVGVEVSDPLQSEVAVTSHGTDVWRSLLRREAKPAREVCEKLVKPQDDEKPGNLENEPRNDVFNPGQVDVGWAQRVCARPTTADLVRIDEEAANWITRFNTYRTAKISKRLASPITPNADRQKIIAFVSDQKSPCNREITKENATNIALRGPATIHDVHRIIVQSSNNSCKMQYAVQMHTHAAKTGREKDMIVITFCFLVKT